MDIVHKTYAIWPVLHYATEYIICRTPCRPRGIWEVLSRATPVPHASTCDRDVAAVPLRFTTTVLCTLYHTQRSRRVSIQHHHTPPRDAVTQKSRTHPSLDSHVSRQRHLGGHRLKKLGQRGHSRQIH